MAEGEGALSCDIKLRIIGDYKRREDTGVKMHSVTKDARTPIAVEKVQSYIEVRKRRVLQ